MRAEPRNVLTPLAAAVDLPCEKLAEVIDLLFGDGLDALAGPTSASTFSTGTLCEEDLARTIHAMGTSLLSWMQDMLARGIFAPTRACSD